MLAPSSAGEPRATAHPSFTEAFRFWLKLGFISFGGPTGQIAIMHDELVQRRRWIGEARFLHALNYCMLLPGPEAQQLAIYVGWLLHRARGGLAAGILFVLPSIFILWALSYLYAAHGDVPSVAAAFYGLKPAVTAIVAFAVLRIGRKTLKNGAMWAVAGLAFIAIFVLDIPFPLIVLGAAVVGLIGARLRPSAFSVLGRHGGSEGERSVLDDDDETPAHAQPSARRSLSSFPKVCKSHQAAVLSTDFKSSLPSTKVRPS